MSSRGRKPTISARWRAALARWSLGPTIVALAGAVLGTAIPEATAIADSDLPEYRLKAAFLYNFALFTEWPSAVGPQLHLCVVGEDPFGPELALLEGKTVGERRLVVDRQIPIESLASCQLVFISASGLHALPRVLHRLEGMPALTVADTPGSIADGVVLNMTLAHSRITFEANLEAARAAGLTLSSKLLRLATEVRQ